MATLGEGTEPEPRGSPGVGPWEVLWKYLEVPPLQVQELGAPDVVPCEDVLILTETKMLQPGGNLLRAPKMSCRRRRRERGQGPGPGRRQPAPQNAHMPQQPGPRDASSRRPPPSHPGTARAVQSAAGGPPALGSELRRGCRLFLPGGHLPSRHSVFPECRAADPRGTELAVPLKPAPLHLRVHVTLCHGRKGDSHFMWSEPPPLKKNQFLDKQKKNQKELP